MYDLLIYIGRFQPLHNAHLDTIMRASKQAHTVLVITGSAYQPRTYKNPWTTRERILTIKNACADAGLTNVAVEANRDSVYNDQAWIQRVQELAAKNNSSKSMRPNIGIIGHKKDDSSSYLEMFPQWDYVPVDLIEPLDATNVRELYFNERCNMNFIKHVVPRSVYVALEHWQSNPSYAQVIAERRANEVYKAQFSTLPYPPIFVTADPVVFCAGHVLLVERGKMPGKGLLALPGGFVNANDSSVESAMLRELKEETNIKVPVPVLRGSIKDKRVFDHPDRSARGRTITHAFNIVLNDTSTPKVRAADDAAEVHWKPFNEINSEWLFEDHYDIIQHFLGR
jgi:bifunctional NMN adenylyltransferase/nudix hydrolase